MYLPPISWTRSAIPHSTFCPKILCSCRFPQNLVVSGLRVHKIENLVRIDTAIETRMWGGRPANAKNQFL